MLRVWSGDEWLLPVLFGLSSSDVSGGLLVVSVLVLRKLGSEIYSLTFHLPRSRQANTQANSESYCQKENDRSNRDPATLPIRAWMSRLNCIFRCSSGLHVNFRNIIFAGPDNFLLRRFPDRLKSLIGGGIRFGQVVSRCVQLREIGVIRFRHRPGHEDSRSQSAWCNVSCP